MYSQLHEACEQCAFDYARIDTEVWNSNSSRRIMCPVCGWTRYEEHKWEDGGAQLVKSTSSVGYGAYRLIPPGGFSGYNAFHTAPAEDVVAQIKELLSSRGWKGYLTLWDPQAGRPRLVAGSPLQKYEMPE